jgi:hypothetical protein
MLSGTKLVLLAMYSTVNVVGPTGSHLDPNSIPALMCLLIAAAVMTCWLAYSLTVVPKRPPQKGPKFKPLRRSHSGPTPRRV